MSRITKRQDGRTDVESLRSALAGCGFEPIAWTNPEGYSWEWHAHKEAKTVFCVAGSVTFHTRFGDVHVEAGDRLDIPAGAEHGATAGQHGVTCIEVSPGLLQGGP